jgi:hypothetical protein
MKKLLFTIDNLGQAILLGSCLFFPFTFIAAIPLGGWQLTSSLLKGLLMRSSLHLYYFLAATMYCVLLGFGAKTSDHFQFEQLPWATHLWFVLALPPVVGAVWYFVQSVRDMRNLEVWQPDWV